MELLPRNRYLDLLTSFYGSDLIRIVTGLRRSGKKTLLLLYTEWLIKNKAIKKKNIVLINFESPESSKLRDSEALYKFVIETSAKNSAKLFLLFNEIQNVRDWEKTINSLRVDCDCEIVLTSSTAKLLSGELATLLSGRYVEIEMFPLSLDEFKKFRPDNSEDIHVSFDAYKKYGGLPGIHELQTSPQATMQYLNDIFNSILLKDVVHENGIRDTELLYQIIKVIFENLGRTYSAKKISELLKDQGLNLGMETVYNYLDYLQNAFVISRVKRLDIKRRRYLDSGEKIYAADIGFINSFPGFKCSKIEGILENLVFLNLRQKGFQVSIGKVYASEVDFVATKNGLRLYIQICCHLTKTKLEEKVPALKKIRDNYPKLILTLSDFASGDLEGILVRNLVDFLAEPKIRILLEES